MQGLPLLTRVHAPLVRAEALLRACPPGARLLLLLGGGGGGGCEAPELASELQEQLRAGAALGAALESRAERLRGKAHLRTALGSGAPPPQRLVAATDALDCIWRAGAQARDVDLEGEAMAAAGMGRVHWRALGAEGAASRYFCEAIALALACAPRSLAHCAWLLEVRE